MPDERRFVRVRIDQWAAWKDRHGLRTVRSSWPRWSSYPVVEVERATAPVAPAAIKRCAACGQAAWVQTPDGRALCAICHPPAWDISQEIVKEG